jgi:hypothetical protein
MARHAAAAHGGHHGDGIEPRDHRARAEQHDGVAGEAAVVLRHQHIGAGRAQEALQAPSRQPVGGEDAMLERGQRVEIAALGVANADRGVRRMGKGGGHRHQQGRPIDTSFDSSFATPAHRPQGFEPVCRRPRPTEERRQESRNGTRQNAALLQRRSLVLTRSASFQPGPHRNQGQIASIQAYRCNQGTPRPRKKPTCDRRERPHPPPRRSKRPARISSGRACFCAGARETDDAGQAWGKKRRQLGRMTRRQLGRVARRQGRRGAHWPRPEKGLEHRRRRAELRHNRLAAVSCSA